MSHDRITPQDEALLADELGLLAHDSAAPPSTVDIAGAVQAARRVRRRRRRARTAGAALVLAAAVSVGATLLPGTRPDAQHHGRSVSHDPLTVAADFTWLPEGFSIRTYWISSTEITVRAEAATAVPNTPWIPGSADVQVYPRGVDPAVSGGAADPSWKHRIQAPDVNGRPAYWMSEKAGGLDGFGVLRWRTADGRWAEIRFMYWDPKRGDELLRMAAGVTLGERAVPMPFYVRGLPSGFSVALATRFSGRVANGSPQWSGALGLTYQGHEVGLSVSGLKGGKPVATGTDHGNTTVCRVENDLQLCAQYNGRPGEKAPAFGTVAGLQGLLRLVHPLGADPAGWTTDVLR